MVSHNNLVIVIIIIEVNIYKFMVVFKYDNHYLDKYFAGVSNEQ